MMRLRLLSGAALALLSTVAACSSTGDDASQEANETVASDRALARELVGMLEQKCSNCHEVSPSTVRVWGDTMQTIEAECLKRPGLTASQRIDCLRDEPHDATAIFSADRLGLFASGASQPAVQALFQQAFPKETAQAEFDKFVKQAGMPRAGARLTADEFAKLEGWVMRGMPQLDSVGGDDSGTATCTPNTTPALQAHLAKMKTAGWGARLAEQATPMFGCGTAQSPLECLTNFPDATAARGAPGVTQTIRQFRKQSISRYWARSSADGRWIGFGGSPNAKIVDLAQPENATPIKVAALYDPNFFPSNDGFAFAGTSAGGFRVCKMSVLTDAAARPNPSLSLTESKCMQLGTDVYQSIGAALDGSRYFVTWGQHRNDNGGTAAVKPLDAAYPDESITNVVPMVNDGLSYRAQPATSVTLPGEGDMMTSPSSLLAANRFGGAKQVGYRVRFLKAAGEGSNLSVSMPLAAEVCVAGSKVNFSFDERFMVVHQYVDPANPGDLPAGSSNIVLIDLATGKSVRITQLKAKQFALYPHFRADGWFYFIIRDMAESQEYVLASDAAIRLAQQ